MNFIKKYLDLIIGGCSGIILSILVKFNLQKIQLCYSIIILILVSMGLCRMIKKEIEKRKGLKSRNSTVIDKAIDTQTSIKAVELAYHPMRLGEDIGYLYIDILKKGRKGMRKFKVFLDKFKGYIISTLLLILGLVEAFGNYIIVLVGNKFVVNGVNMVALVVLLASLIVSMFSNKLTKEQKLILKPKKSEADISMSKEVKKTYDELALKLKCYKDELVKKEKMYDDMKAEVNDDMSAYSAKFNIQQSVPGLDLKTEIEDLVNAIKDKKVYVANLQKEIDELKTNIKGIEENQIKLKGLK